MDGSFWPGMEPCWSSPVPPDEGSRQQECVRSDGSLGRSSQRTSLLDRGGP
jgi:hypothetical protein